jgi:D-alanyl-D-alanine carboxypeptidase/D-alanyl-D-alanine-endopeptidase (penicillin-binding protein 4)
MIRLLLLLIITFNFTFSQSLQTKIDQLLENEFFQKCGVSVQVEDLSANKTIYQKNARMLFRPASNMKILTTVTGLIYLRPDYEFKTSLYHSGIIKDSVLYGNLYFVGGCDPDFTTKDFYFFIDTLKASGIHKISGNIYGDVSFKDSLFWGNGWMWDDDPSSDAPYLSALNLNDNCVDVIVNRDKNSKQLKVKIVPDTKYVSLNNGLSSQSDKKFLITRDWIDRKNEIIVEGKLPEYIDTVNEVVNVFDPTKYFLTVFSEILDSNSISFVGQIDEIKTPLYARKICDFNRPFGNVIINLNKTSDNLSAEMTLRAISEKYSGKPANADSGILVVKMILDSAGFNSKEYRLVDGSGVSHYNLVSAELLAKLLKYIYDKYPDLYKILYDSFPIAGVDGTLENRMQNSNAINNVHAKTGTLSGVSCLSGYVQGKNNHQLVFSIMMQNFVGSSKNARDFQDEICKILADYDE